MKKKVERWSKLVFKVVRIAKIFVIFVGPAQDSSSQTPMMLCPWHRARSWFQSFPRLAPGLRWCRLTGLPAGKVRVATAARPITAGSGKVSYAGLPAAWSHTKHTGSGDLAEWARKSEFEDALEFLVKLSDHLKLPRRRFVIVPGNHDINRSLCESYFKEQT